VNAIVDPIGHGAGCAVQGTLAFWLPTLRTERGRMGHPVCGEGAKSWAGRLGVSGGSLPRSQLKAPPSRTEREKDGAPGFGGSEGMGLPPGLDALATCLCGFGLPWFVAGGSGGRL